MLTVEKYNDFKQRVEQLVRDLARAEGALQQNKQRLFDEHGCKTLKAAEKLLGKLDKELEEAEAEWEKECRALEKELEEHED